MAKPSPDDMHLAAQWLEIYEGAEDAEACKRVAEWLRKESDKLELQTLAREVSKETGIPVKVCLARLKQKTDKP